MLERITFKILNEAFKLSLKKVFMVIKIIFGVELVDLSGTFFAWRHFHLIKKHVLVDKWVVFPHC